MRSFLAALMLSGIACIVGSIAFMDPSGMKAEVGLLGMLLFFSGIAGVMGGYDK